MTDWKKIVKEFKDFGQDSAKNLCEALSEEQNIEKIEFKISSHPIGNAGWEYIGKGFSNCKNLHSLSIEIADSHNIGKDGMIFLSKNLKDCSQLVEFNMQIGGFNHIRKEGSSALKQILENLTQLQRIFLSIRQQFDWYFLRLNLFSKNDIGEQGAIQIGQGLKNLHNLQSFSIEIGQNFIGHEGIKGICEGLKDLQNLKELSFNIRNMNNIGPQGSQEIGKLIQKLQQLEIFSFTIYNNQILQEGIEGIGQGLSCCQNLLNLSMEIGNNSIGSQGAIQLGKGLNRCYNLQDLHLIIFSQIIFLINCYNKDIIFQQKKNSGNEIGHEGCTGLALGFENLLRLENLYLSIGWQKKFNIFDIYNFFHSNNKIGSQGVISLGEQISKCINLRLFRLEFYQNEITQDGILKFGSKIRHCSQLYYFQFTITDINLETQQVFVRKLKKAANLVKIY
ncbi:hypothetical protein ABPG74_004013 [Tetrahymena malaccensis]